MKGIRWKTVEYGDDRLDWFFFFSVASKKKAKMEKAGGGRKKVSCRRSYPWMPP